MSGSETDAAAWVAVVLSAALAIAGPAVTMRLLARPHQLRKQLQYSRPCTVGIRCAAYITVLVVIATITGVIATRYPFLWATVALCLSGALSIVLYVSLYFRMARQLDDEYLQSLKTAADKHCPPGTRHKTNYQ